MFPPIKKTLSNQLLKLKPLNKLGSYIQTIEMK